MQKITTKNFGTIEFIRTWTDGTIHIGKTKDGSYRHIGGPPVQSFSDLDAIPYGPHKDEAEAWFATKDVKPKQPVAELAASAIAAVKAVVEPEPPKPVAQTDIKICPICNKELKNALGLSNHMKAHLRANKAAAKHPIDLDAEIIDPNEPRETEI